MKILNLLISILFVSIIECKNYYDILGVSKTDSTAQIKKAFRNLALKYHPDKNPDKSAEAKFREIVEAYEVLSDPDKRKVYDQTGGTGFNDQNFNSEHNQNFNFHDFFRDFDEAMKNHHRSHNEAHERAHREHMRAHRESMKNNFMFDFDSLFDDFDLFGGSNDDFGGFGSVMGDSFFQEMNVNQNGRNCRTIRKQQGNTIMTHTECS